MASVASSDLKLIRKAIVMERRPLMLKDYLRDDLSSCSSNGFKSFPRRQCCTTVRYLLEKDLTARDTNNTKRLLRRSRSKAASTTISALQRASEAVLNAVKHLPFTSVKSSSSSGENRTSKGILPRSFSRKLLKRSFWKRKCEIERWKSLLDLLEEKEKPSDFTTITTTTASTSDTSNSNSWSDSEFTSEYLQCSSGNSECSGENEAVKDKKHLPEKKVSQRVGVAVGEDSMEAATTTCSDQQNSKKQWPNEEEKEQFSPISVLDCPFDDEEEVCSPFQRSLTRMEGTKKKLMQKIRRFESVAQLEPVDLEKRIASSEIDDNESLESPKQYSSSKMSIHDNPMFDENEEENKTEQKVQDLLKLMKTTIPSDSFKYKADNLLLDFFRERIVGRSSAKIGSHGFEQELLKVAEDWISGHPHELLLDWQVQENRKAYVRDMEERERWSKMDEENEEVALEVEIGVWTSLVNELVFDLLS